MVSNHTSYADGVLLALACKRMGRPLRLLATGGVFRVPVLGGLLRRLGFIRVDRGTAEAAEALAPALEALAAGEAVGLYPEGRITRDPAHWPERAKTGVVRLALASGAPIVPVAMSGSTDVLDRKRNLRRLVKNVVLRPRVRVKVGAPIDARRLMNIGPSTAPTAEEIRLAADEVMGTLVRLLADLRGEHARTPPEGHHARTVLTDTGESGRRFTSPSDRNRDHRAGWAAHTSPATTRATGTGWARHASPDDRKRAHPARGVGQSAKAGRPSIEWAFFAAQ